MEEGSTELFGSYLAIDRLLDLAGHEPLAECTEGTCLFADISGFTTLAENLLLTLGPRRGAEELSIHLNSVYEALIGEVQCYRGSVVAFAGDGITCWFDGDNGRRAITAALAMQSAMKQFGQVELPNGAVHLLAVKVGLAHGPVRRFLVGDPQAQILDVMAGQTLRQAADATSLARKHEIVLCASTVRLLGKDLEIKEWRSGPSSDASFALIESLSSLAEPCEWPSRPALKETTLQSFLLEPVYDRLQAGQGEFLTELRPGVALFARFEGLDFDRSADAGTRLNQYIQWLQAVLKRYGGFLIDIGMGDKGSHCYCCFGAPIAHENNAWRAVAAAQELRCPPSQLSFISGTSIGICSGTLRTGAYGSVRRRTYGALGDAVNQAARLMEHASPGHVLITDSVRRGARDQFECEAVGSIKAKGKAEPIEVFRLLESAGSSGTRLTEPNYALPLVGRTSELDLFQHKLSAALAGQGHVISVVAEAGMGKSRLISECIGLAKSREFRACIGQCQAHGTTASYLVWRRIWRALFGLNTNDPFLEQIDVLDQQLTRVDPSLVLRLPLLAPVLNLPIPDNEITEPLEARLRKASLEALLIDCLRHQARQHPLLLVLEDCHWIDSLSVDLLDSICRIVGSLPVVILLTHRPPDSGRGQLDSIHTLAWSTEIKLAAFANEEAEQLIKLKLAQLFGFEGTPPRSMVDRLALRSAGNPFYLEELLNYLKDQKIDFQDPNALERWEWPDSLQTLILSRIDRLTQTQQSSLKVGSVIGRRFPAAVVEGVQPQVDRKQIAQDLSRLSEAELIALDQPEPNLAYIFRHVMTQEVAYESLPHATRGKLHNAIGLCLEQLYADRIDLQLDLLAFHFDRSTNMAKKRQYLQKAGEAAQAHYANTAAISYYERALPLLDGKDRIATLLMLGKVWELIGEWQKAGNAYQDGLDTATKLQDCRAQARCQGAMGDLLRKQGLFAEATAWLTQARASFEQIADQPGLGQTLHAAGTVAAMQGDYDKARSLYEESLAIRHQQGEKAQIGSLLSNLGILARYHGDGPEARKLMEQSLEIRREMGDRWAVANSLNNLGVILREMGDYSSAHPLLEESLALNRQVGDRWAVANTLTSLAELAADETVWDTAFNCLQQSLSINLDLGDRNAAAYILECFARIAAAQAQGSRALRLAGAAAALRNELGSPLSPAEQQRLDRYLEPARNRLSSEEQAASFKLGQGLNLDRAVVLALQRQ